MKLNRPDLSDVKPKLTVVGVGGAGCNAINNMIDSGLKGVTFVVANTDAQSLAASNAEHRVQLGMKLTEGLGAGSKPEIGHAAAEEAIDEIRSLVAGSNMVFIAGGMGGGTGTGAAAVIARAAKELGALTVGVVTKPFLFEGARRMRIAEAGVSELKKYVDTLIVIPNQNLFRLASDRTTFAESFLMADQVLYAGIACIVDLIIKEGLINLDFADVRTIMSGMGTAMMGQGEASGERRATRAAEEAISNPLLDDVCLRGAKGLLLSITGGPNLTLYEVDEAASRVRQEVDPEANIIVGATFDEELVDSVRVSIVASGMSRAGLEADRYPGHQRADVPKGFGAPFDPRLQVSPQPPALPEAEMHTRLSQAIQHGAPAAAPPPAAYYQDPHPRAPAPPHLQPPKEHWQAPGNVMIEEGPPRLSPPSHLPPPLPAGFGADPSAPERFTPAPSAEIRRPIPRIPEVDEFPAVGQRVYRAMKGHEPGDGQFHPGQEGAAPNEPQRRLGLFERITGRMRRDSDLVKRGPARSVARSYEDDSMPAERAQAGHYAPPSDLNQDIRNFEQEAEMPVFFDRTRKQS